MIRRPPRSTQSRSSAASDVYKRQIHTKVERQQCIMSLRMCGMAQKCTQPSGGYTGTGIVGKRHLHIITSEQHYITRLYQYDANTCRRFRERTAAVQQCCRNTRPHPMRKMNAPQPTRNTAPKACRPRMLTPAVHRNCGNLFSITIKITFSGSSLPPFPIQR